MTSGTKGIVAYKGKLLLILRDNKPNIDYPNTWEYIGGGQDVGETLEQTGLREIEEEIGIRPANYVYLGEDKYKDGRLAGRFIAILTDDEFNKIKLGNEGQKMNWFNVDDSIKLIEAPGIKRFLVNNQDEIKLIVENSKTVDPSRFLLFRG